MRQHPLGFGFILGCDECRNERQLSARYISYVISLYGAAAIIPKLIRCHNCRRLIVFQISDYDLQTLRWQYGSKSGIIEHFFPPAQTKQIAPPLKQIEHYEIKFNMEGKIDND